MKTINEAVETLNNLVEAYKIGEAILDDKDIDALITLLEVHDLEEKQIDFLDEKVDELMDELDVHNTALTLVRMWSNQPGEPAKFRTYLDNYQTALKELGGSDE